MATINLKGNKTPELDETGTAIVPGAEQNPAEKKSFFRRVKDGVNRFLDKEFTVRDLAKFLIAGGIACGVVFKIVTSIVNGEEVDVEEIMDAAVDADYTEVEPEEIQEQEFEIPEETPVEVETF